jgi:hypothetical protein
MLNYPLNLGSHIFLRTLLLLLLYLLAVDL